MKHSGGCHCGEVRFEVEISLDTVLSCNCSICSRRGTLLAFTSADQFKLLQGEAALTDYQFNEKNSHHLFCRHCGILSFARGKASDGKSTVAINARCVDGFKPAQATIQEYDGASR